MRNRRRDAAGQGQDEKLTTNQRWVVEELKLAAISPLPSRRGGGTRRDKAAGQGRAGAGRTGIGLETLNGTALEVNCTDFRFCFMEAFRHR